MSELAPRPTSRVSASGRLPDFLVIGAMKAGTTSLHAYLGQHPQLFVTTPKELHFFIDADGWESRLDWYTAQFEACPPGAVAGEASVTYTKFPRFRGVPERIAATMPGVRLVYLLRDPIERMRSHYAHEISSGNEHLPIDRALLERSRYLEASLYHLQLQQYLPHFPRSQILLLTSEELRSDPAATLRRLWTFLGVDPDWAPPREERRHVSADKRAPLPALRGLRGVPVGLKVAGSLPPPAKRFIRRHLPSRTLRPEETAMSPGLRAALAARLQEDVALLRPYMEPGFDGWGIS